MASPLQHDTTHPTCSVPWCAEDVPAGDSMLHVSADRGVAAHHVTVERHGAGHAEVRLEGDHEPMTPVEAFALGCTLQVAAVTAFADRCR